MPVRARDLIRALARFGVTVTPPRGGSSHWLAKREGATYALPFHNGVCRAFGIDLQALKREL